MADEISPEELAHLLRAGDMSEAVNISNVVPRGNEPPATKAQMGGLLEIGKAGDSIRANAHLLGDTSVGRIAQSLARAITGKTPYAGPGLRREDYTDDPEARQPIEPMINDMGNVADVMSMGSLPAVAIRGAQRNALGIGIPPKMEGVGITFRTTEKHPANSNVSQAEVIADLPPPLSTNDRIYQNYAKSMSPDEMLKSEPVWSASANLSESKGISPGEAFAEIANDMFRRMGANRYMTPRAARVYMARERAHLREVEP